MTAIPKPARIKDEAVLDFIRGRECIGLYLLSPQDAQQHTHHCTYFQTKRSEANHIRKGAQTGMRTKPNDVRVLPFCTSLHQEYTTLGHQRFCEKYGLTLEQFEREMSRLMAEFRKLKKSAKPRVQRMIVGLHVRHCVCHQEHTIPFAKVAFTKTKALFRCPVRNEEIQVQLFARKGEAA